MSEILTGYAPPVGTVLSIRMVPSDADVEHLRRAMVDAHQTWQAVVGMIAPDRGLTRVRHFLLLSVLNDAVVAWKTATVAWAEAKRARGGA